MFRNTIAETPFTNNIADECFPNITGESYRGDTTFVASLRALVAPRIPEGESIQLMYTSSDYDASSIQRGYKRTTNCVYEDEYHSDGDIVIHSFDNNEENNKAWLDKMKDCFVKAYPEFILVEKLEIFFSQTFYTLCFINPEHRRVVIFCDALEPKLMHYLQLSIPIILPWYFGEGKEIDKWGAEYELLYSFKEKTPDRYLELMAKLAEPYDFRAAKIKTLLRDFETRYERAERENIRIQINSIINDIDSYNRAIGDLLRRKRDKEIRLMGLDTKIGEDGEQSEIMDFFLCNKNISLDSVSDNGDMYFTVKGYLENFEDEAAERYISNDTSYIYRPNGRVCNNYIEHDDMKLLMTALFVDQTLRMRVCSKYRFNINGNVTGLAQADYPPEYNTYMPNPHIDYYHCLGGYQKLINEMLADNNYIGAITQCIASCQSINFHDSPVMENFMRNIYGIPTHTVTNHCIELPNGEVVDPSGAIEWLKAQEQEAREDE